MRATYLRCIMLMFNKQTIFLGGLLLGVAFFLGGCLQFRETSYVVRSHFTAKQLRPHLGFYRSVGRNVRYVAVGNDSLPTVVFLHGSPSSLSYFKDYLDDSLLLSKAKLYAVDRPGYGYTSGFGKPMTSIAKQAEVVRFLLDSVRTSQRPIILVASSYGTSVACRVAMDYPDLVDGLVLSAPALAPGEEYIYPITHWTKKGFMKFCMPLPIRTANAEKLSHKDELTEMLPLWSNIRVPVAYFQGAEDKLIFTTNAKFAQQMLGPNLIEMCMFPGCDHFITQPKHVRITESIYSILDAAYECSPNIQHN